MRLVFYVWLEITRSNKLTHSFQVGVVRHFQKDAKQWVGMTLGMKLLRMNLVMIIIFCMWLGIPKYTCFIQSIHVGLVKHTWELQK